MCPSWARAAVERGVRVRERFRVRRWVDSFVEFRPRTPKMECD